MRDASLRSEWPGEAEGRVSVFVAPYVEEAHLVVTGASGAPDLATDPAVLQAAWAVITGEPTPGHYLLAMRRRGRRFVAELIAFETKSQRTRRRERR